jgi:hypothetical protein
MLRVQQLKINCPVCSKPDWCLVADDGSAAICRRIESGSIKKCGQAGWLHILGDFNPKKHTLPEKPIINWAKHTLIFAQQLQSHGKEYYDFCKYNNLSVIATMRFNIGWTNGWLTIPMYGMDGKITGIQRRQKNIKRFMKWSDMGVFLPSAFLQYKANTLAVCEGWTDTVAAYEYGFGSAVGKMNCYVGDDLVLYYAKRLGCERVIIFADNDGVGLDGANSTAELLREHGFRVMVIRTREKDLRACRLIGMTINEVLDYGK